jgi:glycerophosphoryl diester phosphodiesterase
MNADRLVTGAGTADSRPPPIVIAHRGASGYVPEHTLTSYFIAIQQGADYVEPDLVSTRDGVLIARHENEIGATTDVSLRPEFASRRTRKVIDGQDIEGWFTEDFTLEELKMLRARERIADLRPANARFDGQLEIPTLEEILSLVRAVERQREEAARARGADAPREIGVYPETKHPSYFAERGLALEPPLLAALRRYGYEREDSTAFIQSFEVANLESLRRKTPIRLVQLIAASGAPYDLASSGDPRPYRDMITPAGLAAIASYADAIGVEKTLVIPREAAAAGPHGAPAADPYEAAGLGRPTSLARDAHAVGLAVHAWTFRAENHFLPEPLRSGRDPAAPGDVVSEVEAYLAAGIDGFFIDQPALGVRARDHFIAASRAAAPRTRASPARHRASQPPTPARGS